MFLKKLKCIKDLYIHNIFLITKLKGKNYALSLPNPSLSLSLFRDTKTEYLRFNLSESLNLDMHSIFCFQSFLLKK